MNDASPLPCKMEPFLDEVARRLWSGHAAVMVGAGFSKNARKADPSAKRIPDWAELGNIFYKKIHGQAPKDTDHYLSLLKLADEVQAAFGRPALDQILRSEIPDTEYEPSPLHVSLMKLPWSDVFTTNYDTLLERATVNVPSRRYDVVVNQAMSRLLLNFEWRLSNFISILRRLLGHGQAFSAAENIC